METVGNIRDSVDTSVSMNIFRNRKEAVMAHIFHSRLEKISVHQPMENFNAMQRLSDEPYPKDNRPRGQADLDSVKYHRRVIRHRGEVEPIWVVVNSDKTLVLLDGAHRLAASYMERKRRIPAFLIESDQ